MKAIIVRSIAFFLCLLMATVAIPRGKPYDMNVMQVVMGDETLSKLTTAIQTAGLTDALQQPSQITVFAPDDAAFGKIPDDKLQQLLNDPEKLRMVLLYHVVSGAVSADNIPDGTTKVTTLEGNQIDIQKTDEKVLINDKAKIVKNDIMANNGVVHVIDTVLMPPDLTQ